MMFEESHKVNCATLWEIQAVNIAQQLEEEKKHHKKDSKANKKRPPLLEDLQAACKYPLITSL